MSDDSDLIEQLEALAIEYPMDVYREAVDRIKELEKDQEGDHELMSVMQHSNEQHIKQIDEQDDKIEELKHELAEVKRVTGFREVKSA